MAKKNAYVSDVEEAYKQYLDDLDWESVLGNRNKGDVLEEIDPIAFNVGVDEFEGEYLITCSRCESKFWRESDDPHDYEGHDWICEDCEEEMEEETKED